MAKMSEHDKKMFKNLQKSGIIKHVRANMSKQYEDIGMEYNFLNIIDFISIVLEIDRAIDRNENCTISELLEELDDRELSFLNNLKKENNIDISMIIDDVANLKEVIKWKKHNFITR